MIEGTAALKEEQESQTSKTPVEVRPVIDMNDGKSQLIVRIQKPSEVCIFACLLNFTCR